MCFLFSSLSSITFSCPILVPISSTSSVASRYLCQSASSTSFYLLSQNLFPSSLSITAEKSLLFSHVSVHLPEPLQFDLSSLLIFKAAKLHSENTFSHPFGHFFFFSQSPFWDAACYFHSSTHPPLPTHLLLILLPLLSFLRVKERVRDGWEQESGVPGQKGPLKVLLRTDIHGLDGLTWGQSQGRSS